MVTVWASDTITNISQTFGLSIVNFQPRGGSHAEMSKGVERLISLTSAKLLAFLLTIIERTDSFFNERSSVVFTSFFLIAERILT